MTKTVDDLAGRWLRRRREALSIGEARVLESAIARQPVSRDMSATAITQGDRLADAIARIGGSWPFIIGFVVFLALWTLGNTMFREGFDPYPFIFLNLVLSMVAALQAPIIMMSQNRQGARDRQDAAHDYEVNLKAEIEIMALHDKLDEMRQVQILTMRDDLARLSDQIAALSAALDRPAGRS